MDRRYRVLEASTVRNIAGYNEKYGRRQGGRNYMPYIVVFIDEIGDLMYVSPDETQMAIARLSQMARAVGIHLIVATQRPSTDVITGSIKANLPSRIAFAVSSSIDSRVIIDSKGAESLLGQGDMLFVNSGGGKGLQRVQGCFVSDDEVSAVVDFWKAQADAYRADESEGNAVAKYPVSRLAPWETSIAQQKFIDQTDELIEEAIRLVIDSQEASAMILQRELNIGYPRAARLIQLLEELGVIGEPVGGGKARRVEMQSSDGVFQTLVESFRLETM